MMAEMYLPLGWDMAVVAPLLLIQATLVQVWAGGVFYRTAWAAARHGGTNMNTLVAVGTSAAYGYSAFVTLWPQLAARWGFPFHLYLRGRRSSSSPWSCSVAGWRRGPRGRPAPRSRRSWGSRPRPPASSAMASSRTSRSSRSSSATSCGSARARRSRSTGW